MSPNQRIASIDLLRGLVMAIMALDHVRDYFHISAMTQDPMDPQTTSIPLYFTRWITHYCAPIFVFLSGISAYLSSRKKTQAEASLFLIKRGLFLVLMEVSVVCFGWTFNPFFNTFVLQVIWAIGMSMVVLGLLNRLPVRFIAFIGLIIVAGHNLLDLLESGKSQMGFFWDAFHRGGFSYYALTDNRGILIIYPVLPWIGILLLGYAAGQLFTDKFTPEKRHRILLTVGLGAMVAFVVLRFMDGYGDTGHWVQQSSFSKTLMDFLDVRKYPPSLIFTLMTLGPACVFLALTDRVHNRFTEWLVVYGKVPFFYYLLHIYLIHVLCMIYFYASGHGHSEIISPDSFFLFRPSDMGVSLLVTWIIWLLVLGLLYYPCRQYAAFKKSRKHWIFSYI